MGIGFGVGMRVVWGFSREIMGGLFDTCVREMEIISCMYVAKETICALFTAGRLLHLLLPLGLGHVSQLACKQGR